MKVYVKVILITLSCIALYAAYRYHQYSLAKLLHKAIRTNNTALAEKLLKQGANPEISTNFGFDPKPLRYAIVLGKPEMVKLLLDYGASMSDDSSLKYEALNYSTAIADGRLQVSNYKSRNAQYQIIPIIKQEYFKRGMPLPEIVKESYKYK